MRTNLGLLCLFPILLLVGSSATAQEIAKQRPRDAIRSAKTFVAGLESSGKCPAKIEADAGQAAGLVVRPDPLPFFLFVPQMDLGKENFQRKEIGIGYGVPVGYLFGGPMGTPVVVGEFVDWHRMRHTVIEDPKAGKLYFNCLVLTIGRAKDGGLLLHVFGTDEEPLFSVPLEKTEVTATTVEVKDLDVGALRLKLSLTLGGVQNQNRTFGW